MLMAMVPSMAGNISLISTILLHASTSLDGRAGRLTLRVSIAILLLLISRYHLF